MEGVVLTVQHEPKIVPENKPVFRSHACWHSHRACADWLLMNYLTNGRLNRSLDG